MNFSFPVIIAIVNSLGLTKSAGVGVAEKMCGFLMLTPSAYMQSMSAFVAQNVGAGKPERTRKALLYGIISSFAVSVIMVYFSFFHGDLLAGIFAKSTDVTLAAADYLRAYAIDCLLTSLGIKEDEVVGHARWIHCAKKNVPPRGGTFFLLVGKASPTGRCTKFPEAL